MPPKPRITKEQIIILQRKFKRDGAIGAQFGITRQAVHQLREKYGIPAAKSGNAVRNEKMVKMYENGKSVSAIAKRFDMSIANAYRILTGKTGGKRARI